MMVPISSIAYRKDLLQHVLRSSGCRRTWSSTSRGWACSTTST
ncbi:MAG: hypothetical protein R3F59_28720 [Myxococcota bacterium]